MVVDFSNQLINQSLTHNAIHSFIHSPQLGDIALVCRQWRDLAHSDELWKPLCIARWPWLKSLKGGPAELLPPLTAYKRLGEGRSPQVRYMRTCAQRHPNIRHLLTLPPLPPSLPPGVARILRPAWALHGAGRHRAARVVGQRVRAVGRNL